jgi:hypothetical protein
VLHCRFEGIGFCRAKSAKLVPDASSSPTLPS